MTDKSCDESYIQELIVYHFPTLTSEQLLQEPYVQYTERYCNISRELKFFKGYVNPTIIQKAKIYKALDMCSKNIAKKFLIFPSSNGVIIKYKGDLPPCEFDIYLNRPDSYVFVPKDCTCLDIYDFTYYRRLLYTFCLKNHIDGDILVENEGEKYFIFVSLVKSVDNIEQKWKYFTTGGVYKTFYIHPDKLESCFHIFKWDERIKFEIISHAIKVCVKSGSDTKFKWKVIHLKSDTTKRWEKYELSEIIQDEYEAFGVCRILSSVGEILPLIGTNVLYIHLDDDRSIEDVSNILKKYKLPEIPTDGVEIFSQETFEEMSFYRKLGLIQIPGSTWYLLLDLYQNNPVDPHTCKELTSEFKNVINNEFERIRGEFLRGFPPNRFDPQLLVKTSDPSKGELTFFGNTPTISFYMQIKDIEKPDDMRNYFFWQIPDLRETEYDSSTIDAIETLTLKWSDKSIFHNFVNWNDVYLNFVPRALYVFECVSADISSKKYPHESREQSENLCKQTALLKSI